jgi:hypothetical protein
MARIDDPFHYLERGFEYYVSGRFAALNNLQVAPNLFHHAVEMLAKPECTVPVMEMVLVRL